MRVMSELPPESVPYHDTACYERQLVIDKFNLSVLAGVCTEIDRAQALRGRFAPLPQIDDIYEKLLEPVGWGPSLLLDSIRAKYPR
jgi:hypothetical protein